MLTEQQIRIFREEYPKELNLSLQKLFEAYRISDIDDLVKNEDPTQRTQQLSSIISPMNESVLKFVSKRINANWDYVGGVGFDSVWNGVELEHKFSMSASKSWTGHPYSEKLPNHLLMKAEIIRNKIFNLFVAHVNLDSCSEFTSWPKIYYESASFSSLKIHNLDVDKFTFVFGGLTPSRKWCKIKMENVEHLS